MDLNIDSFLPWCWRSQRQLRQESPSPRIAALAFKVVALRQVTFQVQYTLIVRLGGIIKVQFHYDSRYRQYYAFTQLNCKHNEYQCNQTTSTPNIDIPPC